MFRQRIATIDNMIKGFQIACHLNFIFLHEDKRCKSRATGLTAIRTMAIGLKYDFTFGSIFHIAAETLA